MRRLSRLYRRADATAGNPLERRLRRISRAERLEEARAFLETYHDAAGIEPAQRKQRWAEVRRDLRRTGHYTHTSEELAFGARLAWRNTGRCIGRLSWESLEVLDARDIATPQAIAQQIETHLTEAQSDGRIRSIISIFAPVQDKTLPLWIEASQIIRYACHALPDGEYLGDRQNAEATRVALSMGWQPPKTPTAFDLLPYFIRDETDQRHMFELPQGLVREVPITHPDHPGLNDLGLKWYAVPLISGMVLTIGGIDYPCAPFNGYYMGTEIASRNFADAKRYDLLPRVAEAMKIDPKTPLWRDETLTELNRAVLHSYRTAGVTMVDHHHASDQFMSFHRREQAQGRRVAADWRWIVPPQAGSAHEVFHLKMRNFHPVPNYYWDRGGDGLRLMPWYGDLFRRRPTIWMDRIKRRWKIWKRMPW